MKKMKAQKRAFSQREGTHPHEKEKQIPGNVGKNEPLEKGDRVVERAVDQKHLAVRDLPDDQRENEIGNGMGKPVRHGEPRPFAFQETPKKIGEIFRRFHEDTSKIFSIIPPFFFFFK